MNDQNNREVPDRNRSDEVTQVDLPETEETTPHPQTPNPQARQNAIANDERVSAGTDVVNESKIGFMP